MRRTIALDSELVKDVIDQFITEYGMKADLLTIKLTCYRALDWHSITELEDAGNSLFDYEYAKGGLPIDFAKYSYDEIQTSVDVFNDAIAQAIESKETCRLVYCAGYESEHIDDAYYNAFPINAIRRVDGCELETYI
jgi:hypothetical protein